VLGALWKASRRILGRAGTFVVRDLLSSIHYYLGLYEYADSTGREDCISAMVCTMNEEDWVEVSMLSVRDLVEEYVVVDSSTDRTPQIVREVAEREGLKVRLYRIPPGDLAVARLLAVKKAKCKWVLYWDADFVAFEYMPKYVRSLIEELNPRRHYLVYWYYILLCGGVRHLCSENPFHAEHWLFTYSRSLRYSNVPYGRGVVFEVLIASPRLYKAIHLNKVMGLHLAGVRSCRNMAIKSIRSEQRNRFMELTARGLSAEEAAKTIARELYGEEDLCALGRRLVEEQIKKLPEYRGPLPRILVEYLKRRPELVWNHA